MEEITRIIIRDYAAALATAVKNGLGIPFSEYKTGKSPFFLNQIVLWKQLPHKY
jgi:hypothetical protein